MCAEINTQVGGFGTQGAGAGSVNGTEGVQIPAGTQIAPTSQTTIKKSELEAIEAAIVAGIPALIPPQNYLALASKLASVENDIINSICDNMIKAAKEMEKRNHDEYIKRQTVDANKSGPKSAAAYQTYIMSLPGAEKEKEVQGNTVSFVDNVNNTLTNWLVNPMDPNNNVGSYPSPSFIAGALVSSLAAVRSSIGADSASTGVNLSAGPVADALTAVGPSSGLPGDYQAAAAMVAALLYQGAANKANLDTLQNAAGKPPQTLDFAVNFAKQILAIVTKNIEGNGMAGAQNDMIKTMLSAIAINLVYRAGYGGMTGIDMAALLNDPKAVASLPDAIRNLVASLVAVANRYLPPAGSAKRDDVLAGLSKYVDSKASVDSMLETTKLLAGLLENIKPTDATTV